MQWTKGIDGNRGYDSRIKLAVSTRLYIPTAMLYCCCELTMVRWGKTQSGADAPRLPCQSESVNYWLDELFSHMHLSVKPVLILQ
jgi:hypothetical protein